jgi:hypothetical protein
MYGNMRKQTSKEAATLSQNLTPETVSVTNLKWEKKIFSPSFIIIN